MDQRHVIHSEVAFELSPREKAGELRQRIKVERFKRERTHIMIVNKAKMSGKRKRTPRSPVRAA